jgi:hypothetical protein
MAARPVLVAEEGMEPAVGFAARREIVDELDMAVAVGEVRRAEERVAVDGDGLAPRRRGAARRST